MVEVQLNADTKVPQGMMIAFAVCTTLLVKIFLNNFLLTFLQISDST